MNVEWRIPPSTRRWLDAVPQDRPVAVLLRHSVRPDLSPNETGNELPITETGVRLARQLGEMLGERLRALRTSPVVRCVQTAEAMRQGAVVDLDIRTDRLLGDPGVYVLDGEAAWPNWQQRGHEGVMAHLIAEDGPLPGMAAPDHAARFLVHHMLAAAGDAPGIHAFISHDALITATAARLLDMPLGRDDWPWYLEAAYFWRQGDSVHIAYRDRRGSRWARQLCSLNDTDVIEFARREMSATVGLECPVHFFLAGGAFKTLLTGQPPRDLDIWAPSPGDRGKLIDTLLRRGAERLGPRRFGDAFRIADRVVELSYKTQVPTLEERLARFDIALSAVGIEYQPHGTWRAVVHPLARRSVERREVLLLKPLVNWKYALVTLERMRRYSEELDYAIPVEEEAEVWRVFDSQPPEMQRGMMERFDRTTRLETEPCARRRCAAWADANLGRGNGSMRPASASKPVW